MTRNEHNQRSSRKELSNYTLSVLTLLALNYLLPILLLLEFYIDMYIVTPKDCDLSLTIQI